MRHPNRTGTMLKLLEISLHNIFMTSGKGTISQIRQKSPNHKGKDWYDYVRIIHFVHQKLL